MSFDERPDAPGQNGQPDPDPGRADGEIAVDDEWHRLHPLTPFLRGGWFVLAVFGWIISQQWNTLTSLLLPDEWSYEDPTTQFIRDPIRLLILLGATIAVGLIIAGISYLAWRAHRYRITGDIVEVRSGIISKKHSQARLDRVQSIDINRPVFPRLFGAAAIKIDTASASGNIELKYVRAKHAEPLRDELLRRASGAKRRASQTGAGSPTFGEHPDAPGSAAREGDGRAVWSPASGTPSAMPADGGTGAGLPGAARVSGASGPAGTAGAGEESEGRLATLIRARIDDFTDLEADTRGAAPQSVVKVPHGRLIGAAAVDLLYVLFFVVLGAIALGVIATIVAVSRQANGREADWLVFVPIGIFGIAIPAIGVSVAVVMQRLLPNFNYSIIGTPDGVRVSRGFPSTMNETVPPGRIHAIDVRQPLLWRPFGWWEVRMTRAGQSVESDGNSNAQRQAVLLPVGNRDDVARVLDLVAPLQSTPERARIVAEGMFGRPGDSFISGPSRGRWLHPFSWRRIGYVLDDDTFFIRRGRFARKLAIAPAERLQSIAAKQGPVLRMLRLANVQAQTVQGVVNTLLPIVDEREAIAIFDRLRSAAIRAAHNDTSHRWQEAAAKSAIAASQMRVQDAAQRGVAPARYDLAVLDAYREFEAGEAGHDHRDDHGEAR